MIGREYPGRPLVGIGVAVLLGDAVLLVRRGRPPAEGAWSLPGGAQKVGETAEEAGRRELLEEAGLSVGPLYLAGHADSIPRDADGRVQYHYTILDFCAVYTGGKAMAGGDAAGIVWADPQDFDAYGLSADARRIVGQARVMLKAR